jgi:uncharacterized protein
MEFAGGPNMLTEMMAENDIKEILTRNTIGRLACAHANQPYIVPMSYVYDADSLYGFATDGQKNQWMRANPKVCFEVDEISDRLHWASVVVTGIYREIVDSPLNAKERESAQKILRSRSLWWDPGVSFRRLKTAEPFKVILYVIRIASISGYRTVTERIPGTNAGETGKTANLKPF